MKRVISTQAIMANGKTTYTGLFTSEGIPAEVELVCVNGNACLSVTIPEDDEEEYVGRPLTEDEIEAICRNYKNCDDCFICGDGYNDEGERDSCTLTDEQVDKYIQMFPQSVVEISPEEDIGMTMISF